MVYQYSEEQQLFKDSVRKFVEDNYSYEARCALAATEAGYSEDHWQKLVEMGVTGVALPEAMGGFEGDLGFLCAVAEELGRGLVLEPVFPTVVLGAELLAACASITVQQDILPRVAAGECKLALAWEERGTRGDIHKQQCKAVANGDIMVLNGEKLVVLGADCADYLLVSARSPDDKLGLYLLEPAASGVSLTTYPTVDGGRAATLVMENASALRISDDAADALATCLDRALIVLGAQAMGAMDALMDQTREYCVTRKQFGLPLAAFQALQHRLADMYIACEKTRSLVFAAIQAAEQDDCHRAASILKAQVGSAGRYVGQQAIQLHGGIGMTEELSVGAYFKVLTAIDALFGNRDFHLRQLSQASEKAGPSLSLVNAGLARA